MAIYHADVHRALLPEQDDLLDRREHCSADPRALSAIGARIGHQVRVRLVSDPATFALYTVSEARREHPGGILRMGLGGRERLGQEDGFAAIVDSVVPAPGLGDGDARRLGEFVERITDNGSHDGLIAIAPHGGDIEPHTDGQARRVAERLAGHGVSAWWCAGFGGRRGGAAQRLHITSGDIHEASFPALKTVLDRGFRYAVAFHGFRGDGVLIGGRAPFRLKAEIAHSIETALSGRDLEVSIAEPGDALGGFSPRNIVNRLASGAGPREGGEGGEGGDEGGWAGDPGGIQIEQSFAARHHHARAIADAVAEVFGRALRDG